MLQSSEQFLVDLLLSSQPASNKILPYCLLAGPSDSSGHIHCWNGFGEYAGWQGLMQLSDFTSGGKQGVVLVINIEPFHGRIVDLLDPIPL